MKSIIKAIYYGNIDGLTNIRKITAKCSNSMNDCAILLKSLNENQKALFDNYFDRYNDENVIDQEKIFEKGFRIGFLMASECNNMNDKE